MLTLTLLEAILERETGAGGGSVMVRGRTTSSCLPNLKNQPEEPNAIFDRLGGIADAAQTLRAMRRDLLEAQGMDPSTHDAERNDGVTEEATITLCPGFGTLRVVWGFDVADFTTTAFWLFTTPKRY